MSEPQMMEKRQTTVVKCEKHGLHYDSARMEGCVLCRREAGGGTATLSRAAAAPSGSMGQALAVTAVLLLLTTACLYFIHGRVAASFQAMTGRGPADTESLGFDQPMEDFSLPGEEPELPVEDTGGETYSGSEGD